MKSVITHPEAENELLEAIEFYERRQLGLGERFLGAVESAMTAIGADSAIGLQHVHGTSILLVKKFPYGLVYRQREDGVQLLAFAHLRRRPAYWIDRLEDE